MFQIFIMVELHFKIPTWVCCIILHCKLHQNVVSSNNNGLLFFSWFCGLMNCSLLVFLGLFMWMYEYRISCWVGFDYSSWEDRSLLPHSIYLGHLWQMVATGFHERKNKNCMMFWGLFSELICYFLQTWFASNIASVLWKVAKQRLHPLGGGMLHFKTGVTSDGKNL